MAQSTPTPTPVANAVASATSALPSVTDNKTVVAAEPAYPADWDAGMQMVDAVTNQLVIRLVGNGSINAKSVITTLYNYLVVMNPKKPTTTIVGAAQQVGLMRALALLYNATTPDFNQAMSAALALFNAARNTTFSDVNAFRFIANISNLTNDRLTGYTNWLDMMIRLSDPAGRGLVLKQFKFTSVFAHPDMTESGRQRIYQYFNR